jgi:hypothetical protein
MKATTRTMLQEAEKYCNDNDKSTEFMLEYMQDVAGVDLDCVLNYLENKYKKQDNDKDKESPSEK